MKFTSLFLGISLFFFAACSSTKTLQKENAAFKKHHTIVDGESRSYWVYNSQKTESGKSKKSSLPVVFMFHGSKSSGKAFSEGTNFNEVARRQKFIAVYPDALVGNWAEGCGCNNADRLKVKDLEFVATMIRELKGEYNVDPTNIFAVGFSQGGLFVDRLICEMSNELRGAVVVGATMSVPLSRSCNPQSALPVTFIQGTNDPVLPYGGIENGPLSLLSAKSVASFWASQNGISAQQKINENEKVEVLKFSEDQDSTAVSLYSIRGYGHGWPMLESFNTNEKIAEFIARYRK